MPRRLLRNARLTDIRGAFPFSHINSQSLVSAQPKRVSLQARHGKKDGEDRSTMRCARCFAAPLLGIKPYLTGICHHISCARKGEITHEAVNKKHY